MFGENCTLTAIPDDCCVFSHWIDDRDPCAIYSTSSEITVPVVDNIYFNAVFSKKIIRVNVVLNIPSLGGTTGSGSYECGSEITITAFTNICNDIVWREGSPCSNTSVYDEGSCPNGTKTISCTFVATEDITVYADITPNFYTAHARPCPVNGGNVGIIQNVISGFVPSINGEPCIPFSGDGETFFGCEPITFIVSPNNGFEFLGWVSVSDNEFADDGCDYCETTNYLSRERVYETYLCENTKLIACFKRHFLIRFFFNGCCRNLISYSIENGEPMRYTDPFYISEGDSFRIFAEEDDCCVITAIRINGQNSNINFNYTPTEDTTVEIFSEKKCFTIEMVKSGNCELENPFIYFVLPSDNPHIYNGIIEDVQQGSNYLFSINDENECCVLKFWRVYYNGRILTYYDKELEIDDISGNITIECVLENTCHSVTCLITNDCEPKGKLFYFEEDISTHELVEITDFGFYAKEGVNYYLIYASEIKCCEISHWNVTDSNNITTLINGTQLFENRVNIIGVGLINENLTIEAVIAPETEETFLTINGGGLHFGIGFNVVVQDLTTGEFFAPFNCESETEILLNVIKCHRIKVYISITNSTVGGKFYVDDNMSPHINYISGKLLDENNIEYCKYKHGFFLFGPYFTSKFFLFDGTDYLCCDYFNGIKFVNAMIIELDMMVNRTINIITDATTYVHSSCQDYYFNNGVNEYEENAILSDFDCPFLENCVGLPTIQNICNNT